MKRFASNCIVVISASWIEFVVVTWKAVVFVVFVFARTIVALAVVLSEMFATLIQSGLSFHPSSPSSFAIIIFLVVNDQKLKPTFLKIDC